MDRRQFIKVTAATGASATLASCGNPEHQLIRFIPEEVLNAGIAVWKPSICPLCPAGCGVLVRVMEGDAEVIRHGQRGLMKFGLAKKLEGNAAHPVSQGKLCVRGQAAIQVTYHPDRITAPMKRSGPRGSGQYEEISWDDALGELLSHLDALATAGNQQSLAFLMKPARGHRQLLVEQFLNRFGGAPLIEFEVFGNQVLRRANARSFGYEQLPTIDLARSRYVLGFGADYLGTWNSPVSQNAGYGEMRQGRPGIRAKFVQIESRMSQTGANADEWVPANPGTEGILALGIAHVIVNENLRPAASAGRAGAQIEGWSGGLTAYTPEEVEKQTGVAAARIERLAREFAGQMPAVALIGGAPLAQTNGLFNALAVNALNALVGNVGQPGGIFFTPQPNFSNAFGISGTVPRQKQSIATIANDIISGGSSPIQVLLLDNANPVFGAPSAWRVKEALQEIPYIASFGSFLDETTILADLILPDHSFLESWVDHIPESGTTMAVASVAPPAMQPLHQTRAMPDVLLEIGRRLAQPLNPALPWQTYDEMLTAAFSSIPAEEGVDLWTTAQEQGGWFSPTGRSGALATANAAPVAAAEPQFDGMPNEYPFYFLPYASQAFLDGSLAHLPWLQELPDVLTSAMWSSWMEINSQTAERLGIAAGDLVEIESAHGTVQAPAVLSPGIAPNMIAMPVGQGHETFTRYASGIGSNPIRILAPVAEPETGSLAWAATRVKVSKVEGESNLILFAGSLVENKEQHR